MNPEVKESEFSEPTQATFTTVDAQDPPVDMVIDETPLLPPATSTTNETSEQLQQVWGRIYEFLAGLPEYLGDFFGEYKRPLVTIGLIFGSIVSVKLTLALLDAINDIPLLEPIFELVGISYTAWFIYRYLWRAENRRELGSKLNELRSDILGRGNPKP